MRGDLLTGRLARAYRRTGADLPGGDPRPSHGTLMEGWFWRLTDRAHGRVVVALCGVNRHRQGDWATVAVAVHPGAVVRSIAVDGARARRDRYEVSVPGVLDARGSALRVRLGDVELDVRLDERVAWPLRLGGGGVFSALPFLGQYWHPHVLGGRVAGTIAVGDDRVRLDGADVYAERNWGAGFPDRWWWGQAHGFADPHLCVAFGGGRLTAGPIAVDLTGCVLRTGDRVVRFAPPTSLVRADVGSGSWRITARRPRWRVELDGDGAGTAPAVLPVPIPAERRNVDRDFQHLAGRLRLRAWHRGSLVVDDESHLAGLELGSTDPGAADALARDLRASVVPAAGRPPAWQR